MDVLRKQLTFKGTQPCSQFVVNKLKAHALHDYYCRDCFGHITEHRSDAVTDLDIRNYLLELEGTPPCDIIS